MHLTKLLDTHRNEIAAKGLKSNKAFRKAWEESLLLTALIDEELAESTASAVSQMFEEKCDAAASNEVNSTIGILPPLHININLNLREGKAIAVLSQCSIGLQPIVETKSNKNVIDVQVQLKQIAADGVNNSADRDANLLAECTPCTVQLVRLETGKNLAKNNKQKAFKKTTKKQVPQ